jgi:signal transduction histidine kinase
VPEGSTTEVRTGLSTTLVLSVAAVAVALVAMFGEEGAFTPLTVTCALLGLVPWALVAGGVRVTSWLFLLLAVPPGVVIVAVADNPGGMFPLMLAIVWLTRTSRSIVIPGVAVAASFVSILRCTFEKGSADESGIVYFVGGLGIAWLSGLLLRRQEALTAQVEAMRDAQIERLAATERARIARDVHDVVAHSLTVVMLNLTGARRALATDPARADEALERAEAVGRESLDSIRQVMGLLREPEAGEALPQPTIEALPRLVDGYRRAGLDVSLSMRGATDVDPTVGLVAYRVVQESLANVLQHAPGAGATVAVADHGAGIQLTIGNGPPAATSPPRTARIGLGTQGMRERVRGVGGTFGAVATPAGGWVVSAWLPARAGATAVVRHA